MSADFLLELRSEEIPARMQAGARADLERLFRKELVAAGITPGAITVWSTPRRLALIARAMPLATQAVHEEVKGPRTSAPAQALEGFLRKTGLSAEQLTERDGVWFAVLEKPGRATAEVLAAAIPAIIRAFPWPKTQRWGAQSLSSESLRWVRPLSGIVALLGGEVVPIDVGGIVSGRETLGHRFMHQGVVTIDGADDYADKLRAAHVIVDHATREAIVRDGAQRAAADAGLVLVEDEGLVIENAGLTEWPVPLLGRFDPEFLAVPPEVIQLTARVNQKYFICRDQAGALANAFICTANIVASDGGAAIIAGNRKVLAARLSDARFFWDQDQKTPLAEQAKKLARITFHEKLGSLADKVARVADLAEALCAVIPGADPVQARLAADLCKADLVTEMVGEFPELQGLMGGYYARAEGLPDAVADAIRDHYKPVGQGDDVPTAPVSVAVALADKLDTLRGFFAIDEKPTGSKDPFALRRAALGVIRLITDNGLRLAVAEGDLLAFFADRLKVQQREAGVRHDLIDAVFALGGEDDLVRLLARVHALQAFVGTDDGKNLIAGYKRAANILKKETWEAQAHAYTPEPAEAALANALAEAGPKVDLALADEAFTQAMAALASLRAPIDAFFETVTVNDADGQKRASRLGLLDQFRAAVHKVADFSRIEG
ncbi:glycine--tRNA ligase subunit beta [Novosphingobium sp. FSW06-99]|uniref:glycine--tRNA ligase subunit beta n=1 Tax=Novosphingobium sp. FSW06-99 TaxID=1739113 RepID=UPI00076D2F0E|nr:glycine--tRNA ligase subunit beta [Novosphingobium sp. FSW06-99]KUR77450.1 glycine--tRNA ligase subunit beta [Novosphingobium sp. FSW06-99]